MIKPDAPDPKSPARADIQPARLRGSRIGHLDPVLHRILADVRGAWTAARSSAVTPPAAQRAVAPAGREHIGHTAGVLEAIFAALTTGTPLALTKGLKWARSCLNALDSRPHTLTDCAVLLRDLSRSALGEAQRLSELHATLEAGAGAPPELETALGSLLDHAADLFPEAFASPTATEHAVRQRFARRWLRCLRPASGVNPHERIVTELLVALKIKGARYAFTSVRRRKRGTRDEPSCDPRLDVPPYLLLRLHVAHGALKFASTNDAGLVAAAVIVEALDLAYSVRDVRRLKSGAAWARAALRECRVVSDAHDLSFKAEALVAHAMDRIADERRWDSGLVQANILAMSKFHFHDQFTGNPLRSMKLRERVALALSARAPTLETLPSDLERVRGLVNVAIQAIVGSKGREPFRAARKRLNRSVVRGARLQ